MTHTVLERGRGLYALGYWQETTHLLLSTRDVLNPVLLDTELNQMVVYKIPVKNNLGNQISDHQILDASGSTSTILHYFLSIIHCPFSYNVLNIFES